MATIIFIVITISVFASGLVALLRALRSGKVPPWQKLLFTALLAVIFFFVAWLAVMVLLVGPSLRNL